MKLLGLNLLSQSLWLITSSVILCKSKIKFTNYITLKIEVWKYRCLERNLGRDPCDDLSFWEGGLLFFSNCLVNSFLP